MNDIFDLLFDEESNEENNIQNNQQTNDSINKPLLPISDNEHIIEEVVNLDDKEIKIQYKIPQKPSLEHELEMWDVINQFEINAWNPNNEGLKTGFDSLDKAFDGGLKPGFVIIAGDSNIGKTGFMTQVAWQVSELNDNVYVMDFSLDDPMQDKLARVIACGNKVLINAVKFPNKHTQYPLMLVRRKEAINKLREKVNKYKAYDANFTTFIEDIEEEIKRIKIILDSEGLDRKLVVFIDNLHDLNIKNKPSLQDKQKFDEIAQWCADTAIRYNITLVTTAELKKLNGNRRPALDDIREAVKIKYEAKAVLLVYNEVHYKGEGANVYFLRANDPTKQPVFEVHVAKNKFHTFKGRLFFEFYPEMSYFQEADEQSSKHYASLAFNS